MVVNPRAIRALAVLVVGALVVVPVWASPVLVTTDGPSHVYNAAVADAVLSGRPPYASYMKLHADRTRPNQATQFLLVALGRALGWETGERVVLTLAVVATLAALVALVAHTGPAPFALLVPAAGWIAQAWFAWMGFYDFALSLACYAALGFVLRGPPTPRRWLLAQTLFAGLYLTHFLTFAVGAGLALVVAGWRAVTRRGSWAELAVAGPALALVLLELGAGGTGTKGLVPADVGFALRGLVIGDFVMSVHALDAVAGAVIMAAVWFTLAGRLRAARRAGLGTLSAAELFGVLLLVLSVVGPDKVGEGGFVAIRLRCLGVITLLPTVATGLAAVPTRWLGAASAALSVALVAHGALIVRDARVVGRSLALLEGLFTRAGVDEGAWVRTRFSWYRRGLYGIAGYHHIADRVALRRRLVILDNFEPLYGVFPVSWRRRPDWVTFRPSTGGLTVRLIPGEVPWPYAVYVVHQRERPLQVADERLEIGPTLTAGEFALTPVRRRL